MGGGVGTGGNPEHQLRPFGFAGGAPNQPPADPYGQQTSHAERMEAVLGRIAEGVGKVVNAVEKLTEETARAAVASAETAEALRRAETRENSAAERARKNAQRRDSAGGKKTPEKR